VVVEAIGIDKFLKISYNVAEFFSPDCTGDATLENLASKYPNLCWDAWRDIHPDLYADGIDPCQQELGYTLIELACGLFENALDDAWDGYPGN
jgi:hypothetical protein